MKKLIIGVIIFLLMLITAVTTMADQVILNSSEIIDTPTAAKMYWYVDYINVTNQTMKIRYRWLDSNNSPIRDADSNNTFHTWTCTNRPDQNAVCTDIGIPEEWCTGLGTGTGDSGSTCFTDVFQFNIRQQDVGTSIGIGLRTLIWNQMKQDVLTPGNDGTFE